jgi:hypothetical protein
VSTLYADTDPKIRICCGMTWLTYSTQSQNRKTLIIVQQTNETKRKKRKKIFGTSPLVATRLRLPLSIQMCGCYRQRRNYIYVHNCGRRSRMLYRQPSLRKSKAMLRPSLTHFASSAGAARLPIWSLPNFVSGRYHSTQHLPLRHRSHRNSHPTLAGQLVARKRI